MVNILAIVPGHIVGRQHDGKPTVLVGIPTGRFRGTAVHKYWPVPTGVVDGSEAYRIGYLTKTSKHYWLYTRTVYATPHHGLKPEEVAALVNEADNRRRIAIAKAISLQTMAQAVPDPDRLAIPQDVKMFVWQRDGGRCVLCGSRESLEFGHIIPFYGAGRARRGTCNWSANRATARRGRHCDRPRRQTECWTYTISLTK